jgi:hypothetical protein
MIFANVEPPIPLMPLRSLQFRQEARVQENESSQKKKKKKKKNLE